MSNEKALEELERAIKDFEDIKRSGFIKQIEYGRENNPLNRLESELNKIRDDFDKYRTDQAAYQATAELREKNAEKRAFWKNILSSAISAIIGGLVVYYWPFIVVFLSNLLH